MAGLHRQGLLGPVQRLDLGLFVHTQHDRVLRRPQIQTDHIGDLGLQLGVGRELERLGLPRLTPYRFQAAATVTWLVPKRSASSRDDQCVTPSRAGGGVSVSVTIRRGSTDRFRPERFSSASPAMPCSAYRIRHVFTVGRLTPTSRAMSTFGVPPAASNTIRARAASPARPALDRVSPTSSSRSPSRNSKGSALTPAIPQCLTHA